MMRDPDPHRGSGRTQRMLDDAAAYLASGGTPFIVVARHEHISLCLGYPGARDLTRRHFATAASAARGGLRGRYRDDVFLDHAVGRPLVSERDLDNLFRELHFMPFRG